MRFKTHNDKPINTDFTGLRGYIQATRNQLIAAFGSPHVLDLSNSDGKVNLQWQIEFENGKVATIYDWMRSMPQANDVISWHIGAHDFEAERAVHDAFRAAHNLSARAA